MKVDGRCTAKGAKPKAGGVVSFSGVEAAQVYKKSEIDLSRKEGFVDFGDWGVRLVARNDGVAYRFETKRPGKVKADCEKAEVAIPERAARCWANLTDRFGCEETIPVASSAGELKTAGKDMIYLPFAYSVGGKCVAVTESDVRDYPV